VTPPIEAPSVQQQVIPLGHIPLSSSVSQWPPSLLAGLIDDLDETCRTVHETMAQSSQSRGARNEAVLAAAEAVRSKVAAACRTLTSGALSEVGWITPTFRERVEQLLDSVGGEPRKFLEGFRQMDRMRSVNIEACERWLAEQNYLADMPTAHETTRDSLSEAPRRSAGLR